MKTRYLDLIDQTFDFPQEEFKLNKDHLEFHGINLKDLVEEHGTPLKFMYLPKISENIQKVQNWFQEAIEKLDYSGVYEYCYCTKSSHFSFVLEEVLKNKVSLETSSSYDIDIIRHLFEKGQFQKDKYIICNGYKTDDYIEKIGDLVNSGFTNCLPIIDNFKEAEKLSNKITDKISVGIRIASEEEPKFNFYTSRLGIRYHDIVPFYERDLKHRPNIEVKMLHFFINTGITDTAYYWNELTKCLRVYCELKKVCPELDSLNIGGGFPIKNSLGFDFDYYYMIEEILTQVKNVCAEHGIQEPNILTEFGSYTVGEAGGSIYKVIDQKLQNDREKWNMIDSSFMTTLPDTWAINQRFVMLPINRWKAKYERVLLGGLTCDSDDYYNSEQHTNAIYLPEYVEDDPLYIGFFNTGAYQETVSGYGGLQHCLIPSPKMILIQKDKNGALQTDVFSESQSPESFMQLLGY
jgi:arginine decarboxylase